MAKVINSNEFNSEVLNSNEVVLVDFSAEWCGPCKMLAPIIDELSNEMEGKSKVFKIDVDQSGDIAQKYNIMNVPTVMIFKNGEVVEKVVGFQPKEVLKGKLEQHSK
jgi:thioredoxin 1